MNISLENIGPIKKAQIKLNNLTVIFGKNNTGKTYLAYSIFGLLSMMKNIEIIDTKKLDIDFLLQSGFNFYTLDDLFDYNNIENKTNDYLKDNIKQFSKFFSLPANRFTDSIISLSDIQYNPILDKIESSLSIENNIFEIDIDLDSKDVLITVKDNQLVKKIPVADLEKYLNKMLSSLFMNANIAKVFPVTSERTGISVFYKDLDSNRTQIIDYIQKNQKINIRDMILKLTSRYMAPIQYNIDFIRDYNNVIKNQSFLIDKKDKIKTNLISLWKELIDGKIKYSAEEINYTSKDNKNSIPLYTASSSIKALVILDLYIKYYAKSGDVLIIDEPELNLHPDKQILFCKIISLLIKCNIKVVITTHSDYILRELSNMIIMNKEDKELEKFLKERKYLKFHYIDHHNISLYEVQDAGYVVPIEISEDGFSADLFDSVISAQNEITFNLI